MMNGLGQHEDCLVNDFGLNPQGKCRNYDLTFLKIKIITKTKVVFDLNTKAVRMNPISAST